MKTNLRIAILLTLVLVLILPSTAMARGLFGDRIVFGDTFTLESGETLDGNLIVFGGNAILEVGSQVDGDVVLMGGNLEADGSIGGSVVAIGGLVSLGETSLVEGDVAAIGAQLDKAEGARIIGEVINNLDTPLVFPFTDSVRVPRFEVNFSPIVNIVMFFMKVLLWSALAVLVVLFMPEYTQRVGQAAIAQPPLAGGLGLLTVVALPVVVIALTITILLIPVSLLVIVLFGLAWIFGLIGLGLELGKRLAELTKQEWAPAVSSGVGTLVLILVLNGVREVIPCIGWIPSALAGLLGLGAVLLTRFGSQAYQPQGVGAQIPAPPSAPQPPEAPMPPQPETDEETSSS